MKSKHWVKSVVFAAIGILLMVIGVFQGETGVMFKKAIHICLECIGIG